MKKILFFGDSITDAGRDRNPDYEIYINALGTGFVKNAATMLAYKYGRDYYVINRGIGGNHVSDLIERFEEDVVREKPDYLNILVGVNDVWHGLYNPDLHCSNVRFSKNFRELLTLVKNKLPNTKVYICLPFISGGFEIDKNPEGFSRVYKFASIEKRLAKEFGFETINLQKEFDKALKTYEPLLLTADGVHPNTIGADLIAKKWFKAFNKSK